MEVVLDRQRSSSFGNRSQDEVHDLDDIENEYHSAYRSEVSRREFANKDGDEIVEELARRLRDTPAPTQLSSTTPPHSISSTAYIDLDDADTNDLPTSLSLHQSPANKRRTVQPLTVKTIPTTPPTRGTRSKSLAQSHTRSSRRRRRLLLDLDSEDSEIPTSVKRIRISEAVPTEPRENLLARLLAIRRQSGSNTPTRNSSSVTMARATVFTSTARTTVQTTIDSSRQGMSAHTAIVLDDD